MKILITKSAFSDFEAIKEYYLEEGVPDIGNEFVVAIIEHIQTLEQHPDIGRPVPEFNNSKIRELIHAPFRVVYLREISTIHVVRIWRSERILVLPDEKT
ncbi:type II toxin-antitoxin system RelE/ParE family toxin [Sedimenticola selenatireducens]|uniref:Type II toxin-antitoxin system RelE/ParE family toxin n=1 Tax=Sedimenticola selenatireducens TaxID=191960 RepID=A0A557SBZ8_9GAMM|nr:type II toxin-antitoxin system RelE/ParE family toxin [Sedimenticola selenatireducens]TVO74924.1 type II toxin-antitoxin system RelE/ParE family toxin [Sedimenticola selenatireducens]TVT62460.1 MAG: type II toxin-antitoxin system RelE/ParE family toxin [Sedimenticola selenatireducens]